MSFIATGIMAAASIAGGAIQAKGAKDAAKTAAKGSQADLAYQKEGRDLARGDAAYGRQAGATALDAMMSMTGLGKTNFGATEAGRQVEASDTTVTGDDYLTQFGKTLGDKGRKKLSRYRALNPYEYGDDSQAYIDAYTSQLGRKNQARFSKFSKNNPFGRAMGGQMGPRAMYNVNEMGPENVYSGGYVTRNPNPATIDGRTGYVQPNMQANMQGQANAQLGMAGGIAGQMRQQALAQRGMAGGPGVAAGAAGAQMGAMQKAAQQSFPRGRAVGGPMDRIAPMMGGSGKIGPEPAIRPFDSTKNPPQPGLDTASVNPETGYPNENPGGVEGGYNFQTDPGYQFRFSEGQRALDRGAGAAGGLLSGGYARKTQRYGQGFASNEFNNVYSRIAGIAGIGTGAANQSGGYAMQAGQGMGNAASNADNASAYGQVGAGNAWANAANQIGQLPWDQWNNRGGSGNGGGGGPYRGNN